MVGWGVVAHVIIESALGPNPSFFLFLLWAQIRSKFKNFCAHHEAKDKMSMLSTEKVQKSKRTKLLAENFQE